MTIQIDISPGELIDKITILAIKLERIGDPAKLKNVRTEHDLLSAASIRDIPASPAMDKLAAELKAVNEKLWDIEDDIRQHEREKKFDGRFIELARAVYHTNDRRSQIKREINDLLGSAITEEKSYAKY